MGFAKQCWGFKFVISSYLYIYCYLFCCELNNKLLQYMVKE